MTTVTLLPVAAGHGPTSGLATYFTGGTRLAVTGSRVGGASDLAALTDGVDSNYFIIEAGTSGSDHQVTPVWADFVLPPEAGTPTAVAIQIRATTPGGSLGADPGGFRDWVTLVGDTSWNVFDEVSGGDTPLTSLESVSQDGYATFDYWYGIVDPVVHSDAGDWFEFSANGSTGASVQAALTSDGLRVTVFMDSWNTVDANFQWAYLTSLELLVETSGVPVTPAVSVRPRRAPALRQLQRGGPGGIGGIPRAVSDGR